MTWDSGSWASDFLLELGSRQKWIHKEYRSDLCIIQLQKSNIALYLLHELMYFDDFITCFLRLYDDTFEKIASDTCIVRGLMTMTEMSIVLISSSIDIFTQKQYWKLQLPRHHQIENIQYASCATISIVEWVYRLELVVYHGHLDKWVDIIIYSIHPFLEIREESYDHIFSYGRSIEDFSIAICNDSSRDLTHSWLIGLDEWLDIDDGIVPDPSVLP